MLLQGRSVHDIGGSGHLHQVPECAYFVMGCVVLCLLREIVGIRIVGLV